MKTILFNLSILHIPRPCSAILALILALAPAATLVAEITVGEPVQLFDSNNTPIKQYDYRVE